MKVCTKCGVEKALDAFSRRKASRDGLSPKCKTCCHEYGRAYAAKNREAARVRAAKWYEANKNRAAEGARSRRELNPEKYRAVSREYARKHKEEAKKRHQRWLAENGTHKREYDRQWRKTNRERKAATDKRWTQNNPEKTRANRRRWAKNNPENIKMRQWINKARRSGTASPNTTARDWIRLVAADPCCYCTAAGGEVDHITPLSRGGTNAWNNLTGSCPSCNRRKSARPLLTFLLERKAPATHSH